MPQQNSSRLTDAYSTGHSLTLAARQVHDVALGFLTAQTQFLEDLHIGLGADQPQVLFGGEVVPALH